MKKVMNYIVMVIVAATLGVLSTFIVGGPIWFVGCASIGQSFGLSMGTLQAVWLAVTMVVAMYIVAGVSLARLIRR